MEPATFLTILVFFRLGTFANPEKQTKLTLATRDRVSGIAHRAYPYISNNFIRLRVCRRSLQAGLAGCTLIIFDGHGAYVELAGHCQQTELDRLALSSCVACREKRGKEKSPCPNLPWHFYLTLQAKLAYNITSL